MDKREETVIALPRPIYLWLIPLAPASLIVGKSPSLFGIRTLLITVDLCQENFAGELGLNCLGDLIENR